MSGVVGEDIVAPAFGVRRSETLEILRRASAFGRTRVGLAITAAIVGVAVIGPFVAPHSPTAFVASPFAAPSGDAALGTDYLGRDVLSRLLAGGRSVLVLSLIATVLGLALGVTVGLVAGHARNWLDDLLMRSADVLLAFPQVVFILLLVSMLGSHLWLIVLAVAVTHAPRIARVARGATLEILEQDFVKASEAMGERRLRLLFADVLPNITNPLLVELGLRLTYSIGLIAAVSFLGFGLQPPAADWGLMINENRNGITVQPWAVALPVSAIALLTIGTNLVTDGIARASIGIERAARAN